MITKDNYEPMLLQYHENLLDRRLREEVEAFLRQNPDIEQEYRQYYSCEPIVTPHHVHYRYKDNLKRKAVQPAVSVPARSSSPRYTGCCCRGYQNPAGPR